MEREQLMDLLWSYKEFADKEREAREKIEALRTARTSTSINLDGMPRGGSISSMEDYIVKLTNLEADLCHYSSEKLIALSNVTDMINLLDDEMERRMMHARYIELKPWLTIADELCYSHGRVRNKHTEALNKLKNFYESRDIQMTEEGL